MRVCLILLTLGIVTPNGAVRAQPAAAPPSIERNLSGLGSEEANRLFAKLENAQHRLKAGEFVPFELLAGSIASYEAATISPRDVFLQASFAKAWKVERVRSDERLASYRISYAPDGLGHAYWDIAVVLETSGELQRVEMSFKPPAPF